MQEDLALESTAQHFGWESRRLPDYKMFLLAYELDLVKETAPTTGATSRSSGHSVYVITYPCAIHFAVNTPHFTFASISSVLWMSRAGVALLLRDEHLQRLDGRTRVLFDRFEA